MPHCSSTRMKIAITIRDERISSLKEMDEERVSERGRDVTIMQPLIQESIQLSCQVTEVMHSHNLH